MEKLQKLFTANLNNEVEVFATTLKDFLEAVKTAEPESNIKSYDYYLNEFKTNKSITLVVGDFKAYNLQEVFSSE